MATTSKIRNYKYIPDSGYQLLSRSFSCFDELNEAVRDWDVVFNQLDQGMFKSETFHLVGRCQLAQVRFNRKIEQAGAQPKDLHTFVIPAQKNVTFTWRQQKISDNCIPIFPLNSELSALSDGDFDVILFSLPPALVEKLCRIKGMPELLKVINNREVVQCHPQQVESLRNNFIQMIMTLKNDPTKLISTSLIYDLENTLPARLFDTLAHATDFDAPLIIKNRTNAIRKIKEYLHNNSTERIRVTELCNFTGYSQRALEYIFQDYYGITPKAYLQIHRLNAVRKALRKSDPCSTVISDVANHYGFWHMGQFAADYRNLFGELPSETMGRLVLME